MLERRLFLGSCIGLGLVHGVGRLAWAVAPGESDKVVEKAREFLRGMIDPELDLLPEFRGSETYWLYHDNYLVVKTLEESDAEFARRVQKGIAAFGVDRSGKIEQLFEPSTSKAVFHHHRLDEVARRGKKVIKTERITDRVLTGWEEYADLLLLAAIMEAKSHPDSAKKHFERAIATWDGKGLADRVVEKHGHYATYKLALVCIAAGRLGVPMAPAKAIRERLVAMQNEVGGFITDYKPDGTPLGLANVETTCLSILALRSR